jgi:CBS domain-containing protein
MTEKRVNLLPVLDGEKVGGVVSRHDVVRSMAG